MKKKIWYFVIIGLLFICTSIPIIADKLYDGISVGIEEPYFAIEGRNVDIKFYVWNKGEEVFSGTVAYKFSGDKIRWEETLENITVNPAGNYTLVTTEKSFSYPGLYWARIKMIDDQGRQIYSTQEPFNVHSYGETAAILGVILAIIPVGLIFKKLFNL